MSKTDDGKLFATAKQRYQQAIDKDAEARALRTDDLRFSVLLEQWDASLKSSRENDPNGSRPCLVVDKTNQYVRQIVNDIRQHRPAMKVRAVNDQGCEDVAEVLQGCTRHIEDASRADIAYDWAVESAVRCGLGWFRLVTEYSGDDSFDQDIVIKRVIDVNSIRIDPNSTEPDGSDMRFGFVEDSMSMDEFEEAFPDADPIDFDSDKSIEWFGEKRVLIAEYFWLESVPCEILFLEGGAVKDAEQYAADKDETPILKRRKSKRNQCMWAKMNGKEFIEAPKKFPACYVPLFPVIGNEGFVDGKRVLSGVVRAAKDSQRLYNYVRSAFTESVALAPKAPFIAAAGQIEEFEEWATANSTNHAVLRYKPMAIGGVQVSPPQRTAMPGVPAGLAQDMEICERDIQSTMGMHEASKGENGSERSGIAIQSLQAKGDVSSFHYRDNLGRTIQHLGRVVVGMIPRVYDSQRVLRTIGEDGEHDYAQVDPEQKEAVTEQHDETGAVKQIYNLGVGTYDVTVTVGPSYSTKRQEFAAMMGEMFSRDPQLMQMAGDLYFRSIDMPYSDQIADRLKKMLPPQLQDKPQGAPEIPPEAQQQMAQMNNALHMSEQHMQALEQELGQMQNDIKGKVTEGQFKLEEARIRSEAEAARAMADIEIAKVNAVDPRRLNDAEGMLYRLMQQMSGQTLGGMAPMPMQQDMQPQEMQPSGQAQPSAEMSAMMQGHGKLAEAVGHLIEHSSKPRTRTPVRDDQGNITQIIDSAG